MVRSRVVCFRWFGGRWSAPIYSTSEWYLLGSGPRWAPRASVLITCPTCKDRCDSTDFRDAGATCLSIVSVWQTKSKIPAVVSANLVAFRPQRQPEVVPRSAARWLGWPRRSVPDVPPVPSPSVLRFPAPSRSRWQASHCFASATSSRSAAPASGRAARCRRPRGSQAGAPRSGASPAD